MRSLRILVLIALLVLVALVALMARDAIAAACIPEVVRVSCPSGKISSNLIPTSTATSTSTGVATLTLVTPGGTLTWVSTDTNTLTQTHLCATSSGGGLIPCAGTDGKIDTGWLPTLTAYSANTHTHLDTTVMPGGTKTHAISGSWTLTQTDLCTTAAASGAIPCAGTDSKIGTDWLASHAASHYTGGDQIADAVTGTHGLMSVDDKAKLDSLTVGSGNLYLDDGVDSGGSGYNRLLQIPDTGVVEQIDSKSVVVGDGEVLIEGYITLPGYPGTTYWAEGDWYFDLWRYASSTAGVNEIVVRVYKRTSGGSETELFNTTTGDIDDTTVTAQQLSVTQSAFIVNSTDRLVVKYFAKTDSAASRTLYFTHNGTAHYSHVHTPLTIGSLSSSYVPWTAVEGTGTDTSTSSSKIVNAADPRLSDSRTPTGTIAVDPANGNFTTGTATATATSVNLADGPVLHVTTAGSAATATLADTATTQLWTTLYEVDYTALDNSSASNGAWSLDSKYCYVSNAANATTFAIQNGTGLVITTNTTNVNDSGNTLTAPLVGCALDTNYGGGYGLVAMAPASNAYEMMIWVRAYPAATFAAENERAIVGFSFNANDYGGVSTLGFRIRQQFIYTSSCTSNYCQHRQMNTAPNTADATAKNWQTGGAGGAWTDVSVFHVRSRHVENYYGSWSSGWPATSGLTYAGSTSADESGLSGGIAATDFYPTIWYATANQSTTARAGIVVTHLRIQALKKQ